MTEEKEINFYVKYLHSWRLSRSAIMNSIFDWKHAFTSCDVQKICIFHVVQEVVLIYLYCISGWTSTLSRPVNDGSTLATNLLTSFQ